MSVRQYVERCDGDYYVAGSRVLLDGLIYGWLDGQSPETIAQSFPVLTLEEVYGAIAFYLGHRDEVDAYLKQREADFAARYRAAREQDPAFYQKLADARRQLQTADR
jgi:uncharacterized protein (DUF433 family)